MSGIMHKISDALTGHHTGTNAANTTNTSGSTMSGNNMTGTGYNTAGAHQNMNAAERSADSALARESAQVRSVGNSAENALTGHHNVGNLERDAAIGAGVGGAGLTGAALGSHTNSSYSSTSSTSSVGSRLEADKLAAEQRLGMNTNSTTGMNTMNTTNTTTGYADNAMTRSEEHLLVGKEKVELGTASLNKYVTTEKVSTAVPVMRERVVIEREAITDANRGAALSGPEFKEAHYEVNLMAEKAVAEKEVVPIERVRLNKVVEQSQQYVEADLRKEHIEVVDNTRTLDTAATGVGMTGSNMAGSSSVGSRLEADKLAAEQRLGMNTGSTDRRL